VAPTPSAEPAPPPKPKKYAKVLHTGDSMVGGGLAWNLGPMFKADGTTYIREVVESGPIQDFAQKPELPKWLAQHKPDLVLLSLGANHVPHFSEINLDKDLAPFVAKVVKRVEKYDCIWMAPPLWKPEKQAPFNAWLKEHVAPCKWYDGSHLDISRRVDHIHPDEAGGKVLAEDFWKFYKGEAPYKEPAFAEDVAGKAVLTNSLVPAPSGTPDKKL
jgi:lysophospholipase L1-like esterase